jgi:putative membrane protein
MVARFTVSCCVADASPIGLPVLYTGAGELAEGEWVRIQGMFRAGDFRGQTTPILQADTVETVAQPEHPYLYP